MPRDITWLSQVVKADPDFHRNNRHVVEYQFTAPAGGADQRTHEKGFRVFKADYQNRGIYAGDWAVAASAAVGGDYNLWGGYTLVQIIDSAQLSALGGDLVRVTMAAGSTEGCRIGKAYIGHSAGGAAPYAFADTPVQLKFAREAGVVVQPANVVVSDPASFTVENGEDLVISVYFENISSMDSIAFLDPKTGWTSYFLFADDAATVAKTGYTFDFTPVSLVSKVEIFS